jgi:tRNA uridine 5-carboxymethylaminomethyl modification enzyme
MIDLLLRPEITIQLLAENFTSLKEEIEKIANRKEEILEACEILIKYEGYIDREKGIADKLKRLENIKLKGRINYDSVNSISTEAKQKLKKIDPETIGQASRISGISPSDINILLILLGR